MLITVSLLEHSGYKAAMRGKDVITAGTGRYDNKGFTNNFMN